MDSNKSRSESLDTQLKIVAATFGDILSGEQLEEISRYVDENGMLRCYDKNDFFFIEPEDNLLIVERSASGTPIIHKGQLVNKDSYPEEEQMLWSILSQDGKMSYARETDLSECLVYKCSLLWI